MTGPYFEGLLGLVTTVAGFAIAAFIFVYEKEESRLRVAMRVSGIRRRLKSNVVLVASSCALAIPLALANVGATDVNPASGLIATAAAGASSLALFTIGWGLRNVLRYVRPEVVVQYVRRTTRSEAGRGANDPDAVFSLLMELAANERSNRNLDAFKIYVAAIVDVSAKPVLSQDPVGEEQASDRRISDLTDLLCRCLDDRDFALSCAAAYRAVARALGDGHESDFDRGIRRILHEMSGQSWPSATVFSELIRAAIGSGSLLQASGRQPLLVRVMLEFSRADRTPPDIAATSDAIFVEESNSDAVLRVLLSIMDQVGDRKPAASAMASYRGLALQLAERADRGVRIAAWLRLLRLSDDDSAEIVDLLSRHLFSGFKLTQIEREDHRNSIALRWMAHLRHEGSAGAVSDETLALVRSLRVPTHLLAPGNPNFVRELEQAFNTARQAGEVAFPVRELAFFALRGSGWAALPGFVYLAWLSREMQSAATRAEGGVESEFQRVAIVLSGVDPGASPAGGIPFFRFTEPLPGPGFLRAGLADCLAVCQSLVGVTHSALSHVRKLSLLERVEVDQHGDGAPLERLPAELPLWFRLGASLLCTELICAAASGDDGPNRAAVAAGLGLLELLDAAAVLKKGSAAGADPNQLSLLRSGLVETSKWITADPELAMMVAYERWLLVLVGAVAPRHAVELAIDLPSVTLYPVTRALDAIAKADPTEALLLAAALFASVSPENSRDFLGTVLRQNSLAERCQRSGADPAAVVDYVLAAPASDRLLDVAVAALASLADAEPASALSKANAALDHLEDTGNEGGRRHLAIRLNDEKFSRRLSKAGVLAVDLIEFECRKGHPDLDLALDAIKTLPASEFELAVALVRDLERSADACGNVSGRTYLRSGLRKTKFADVIPPDVTGESPLSP